MTFTIADGFEEDSVGDTPYPIVGEGDPGVTRCRVSDVMAHTGVHSLGQADEDTSYVTNAVLQITIFPICVSGWVYLTFNAPDPHFGFTPDLVFIGADYSGGLSFFDAPGLGPPIAYNAIGLLPDSLFGVPIMSDLIPESGWYQWTLSLRKVSGVPWVDGTVSGPGGFSFTASTVLDFVPGIGTTYGFTLSPEEWAVVIDIPEFCWWDDISPAPCGGRSRPVRMFPREDGQNMSSAPRMVGGIR